LVLAEVPKSGPLFKKAPVKASLFHNKKAIKAAAIAAKHKRPKGTPAARPTIKPVQSFDELQTD